MLVTNSIAIFPDVILLNSKTGFKVENSTRGNTIIKIRINESKQPKLIFSDKGLGYPNKYYFRTDISPLV